MKTERQSSGDTQQESFRKDGTQAFRGAFWVAAEASRVLRTLYEFEHLQNYMSIADSVELLGQDENWQDVRYTYKLLFMEFVVDFRRTLDQAERRISFEMMNAKQNIPFPRVSSYLGHYEVKPSGNGCSVVYSQEFATQPKFLSWLAWASRKEQFAQFIAGMREYLDRVCMAGAKE